MNDVDEFLKPFSFKAWSLRHLFTHIRSYTRILLGLMATSRWRVKSAAAPEAVHRSAHGKPGTYCACMPALQIDLDVDAVIGFILG